MLLISKMGSCSWPLLKKLGLRQTEIKHLQAVFHRNYETITLELNESCGFLIYPSSLRHSKARMIVSLRGKWFFCVYYNRRLSKLFFFATRAISGPLHFRVHRISLPTHLSPILFLFKVVASSPINIVPEWGTQGISPKYLFPPNSGSPSETLQVWEKKMEAS